MLVGELGVQLQDVGHRDDQGDRHEVLDRVVGQLGVDGLIDGVRADRAHQQGVAIGRGARGFRRADVAAGARLVVHHHGLVPALAQFGRHHARGDVGGAAGGEGHDDLHVAFRVVRQGRRGRQKKGGGRQQGGRDESASRRGCMHGIRLLGVRVAAHRFWGYSAPGAAGSFDAA
ncbi:hypothetical protein D3C85_994820 [compost metagenome]